MYFKAFVPECDFSDRKYPQPVEGAHVIARGASGRWCAVMYMGPEYMAEHGITALPYDEFVAEWEANPARQAHDHLEL